MRFRRGGGTLRKYRREGPLHEDRSQRETPFCLSHDRYISWLSFPVRCASACPIRLLGIQPLRIELTDRFHFLDKTRDSPKISEAVSK